MKNTKVHISRHETFHPRFGWLKKGFDKATDQSDIFLGDESPMKLGVGKNMVKSIRYWCTAFKILEEERDSKNNRNISIPTKFGKKFLGENGLDPYLEDSGTLWLLHWELLKSPSFATTWYFFFNHFNKSEFTQEEVFLGFQYHLEKEYTSSKIAESSIKKDVNCILRMYSEPKLNNLFSEDSIESPFFQLGLIKNSFDRDKYYFNYGHKSTLSPYIIAVACLEFYLSEEQTSKTISVTSLLYDLGSPGRIFKLNEESLCSAIEEASFFEKGIRLSESAGIIQLIIKDEPKKIIERLLKLNYGKKK